MVAIDRRIPNDVVFQANPVRIVNAEQIAIAATKRGLRPNRSVNGPMRNMAMTPQVKNPPA